MDKELKAALRWHRNVRRDVSVRRPGRVVPAWEFTTATFEVYRVNVEHDRAWCVGQLRPYYKTDVAGGFYSTRLKALRALRYVIAKNAATELWSIGNQIRSHVKGRR